MTRRDPRWRRRSRASRYYPPRRSLWRGRPEHARSRYTAPRPRRRRRCWSRILREHVDCNHPILSQEEELDREHKSPGARRAHRKENYNFAYRDFPAESGRTDRDPHTLVPLPRLRGRRRTSRRTDSRARDRWTARYASYMYPRRFGTVRGGAPRAYGGGRHFRAWGSRHNFNPYSF